VEYWDKIFQMDWIQHGLVVLGGDLNFTLGALEVWGPATQVDYLLGYFLKKIEEVGMLDIEPTKLSPTWRNKRTSEAHIAKRLDWFLISKAFLKEAIRIRQWVTFGGILTIALCYWK
jgi:hypothetical protein